MITFDHSLYVSWQSAPAAQLALEVRGILWILHLPSGQTDPAALWDQAHHLHPATDEKGVPIRRYNGRCYCWPSRYSGWGVESSEHLMQTRHLQQDRVLQRVLEGRWDQVDPAEEKEHVKGSINSKLSKPMNSQGKKINKNGSYWKSQAVKWYINDVFMISVNKQLTCSPLSPLPPFWPGSPSSPCQMTWSQCETRTDKWSSNTPQDRNWHIKAQ